jgi:hypothetical protein
LCGHDRTNKSRRYTKDDFVAVSEQKFPDRYDYSLVEYRNTRTAVTIRCKIHYIVFDQKPNAFLNGWGCPECGRLGRSYNTQSFTERAIEVHGNRYDYAVTDYLGSFQKVAIICPTHGVFHQVSNDHLRGSGCPKCKKLTKASQDWLTSIGIPDDSEHREVYHHSTGYIFDGFDPATGTAYEFHGDYWHGNPIVFDPIDVNSHNGKSFGTLYQETLQRSANIRSAGLTLVEQWEYEFRKSKPRKSRQTKYTR